jgi:shikimate dehydrogenase
MIRPVQKELYAVIGNPVAHSLSPVMMNAVFEALSIPAVYLALQVDDPAEDLETLSRMGFRGLSVTIPHKESAFRLAERTDDEPARAIGAVNTLRLRGTRWEGLNTDWVGAMSALNRAMCQSATQHHIGAPPPEDENTRRQANAPTHHSSLITHHSLEGKRALVLGAGGVARAVVYGLKRERAAITIINRGIERGKALARAFDCAFLPALELQRLEEAAAFDIIIQCTSVGLMDEEELTLIPDSLLRPGTVVLDTVYRPLWTAFLRKAKAAGCIVVPGVEMLLHQGIAQLGWWFGDVIQPEAGLPVMREALMGTLTDE